MTQLGANGDTALELTKGLRLPDSNEKVKEAFKLLLPKLKGNQYYKLDAANKIYLKENYAINKDFQKLAEDVFDAGVENVNFVDTIGASETINKWVESKTNEKIKKIMNPDMLNAMTRLVLVNALYFNANWSSPFDTYGTEKRYFISSIYFPDENHYIFPFNEFNNISNISIWTKLQSTMKSTKIKISTLFLRLPSNKLFGQMRLH